MALTGFRVVPLFGAGGGGGVTLQGLQRRTEEGLGSRL